MTQQKFVPKPEYITENFDPLLKNVLYKKLTKATEERINKTKQDMLDFMKENGANLVAKPIILFGGGELGEGRFDVEIIMQIDKDLPARKLSVFKKQHRLEGCIMSKYQDFLGKPEKFYLDLKLEIENSFLNKEDI